MVEHTIRGEVFFTTKVSVSSWTSSQSKKLQSVVRGLRIVHEEI